MFDSGEVQGGTATLRGLTRSLRDLPPAVDDVERVDRIRVLEELKGAVAAAQVRETAAFVASQRAEQAAAGVPGERVGRGIAGQVALARRVSPYQAQRYTGWATILTSELPETFAALTDGRVSEWRAMIVARETAWLSREHRAAVDTALAGQLDRYGDKQVETETKKLAYRLDPHGYLDRIRAAEAERRVGLRPAPDLMCRLTALLPVAQGVAAYAALTRDADTAIGQGDGRSRGQLMADTLVQRLTGQTTATDVPVEINLIMTDQTLLGSSDENDEPAHLLGHGPVPAGWARQLVLGPSNRAPRWLRRLYRHPRTGQLAAMDSRRRCFTPSQRLFLRIRDQQQCRTPWCDAPIRHIDHIIPAHEGGPTSVSNGQGYCAACNYAKQAPGWHTRPTHTPGELVITTPTGHTYHHHPPDAPGTRTTPISPVETRFAELLRAA